MVKKTVNITKEQAEWLKRRFIQFSQFVRNMLDEAMNIESIVKGGLDKQAFEDILAGREKKKKGDV